MLLPLPLRLGLDSSDPDEFELRLRFLFAWLIMACKVLPDSLRIMSVERFFEIMIVIILIIFFFYVLLFLFGLGAPSAWKSNLCRHAIWIVLSPLPFLAHLGNLVFGLDPSSKHKSTHNWFLFYIKNYSYQSSAVAEVYEYIPSIPLFSEMIIFRKLGDFFRSTS